MKRNLYLLKNMASIRSILAILWSLAAIKFLWFILTKHGDKVEILTLIIGLIGGTILNSVFGTYFAAAYKKQDPEQQENQL